MGNGIQFGIFRIVLVNILVCLSIGLFAQNNKLISEAMPGFILTKNYDTIYCNIAYQFNEDKSINAFLTTDENGEEVIIDDDVILFNRANEIYVKNNFEIGPYSLKVIEDGAIKLLGFGNLKNKKVAKKSILNMSSDGLFYYIIEAEGGSYIGNISPRNKATFFVEKDDKIFRLKTLEYRTQLIELLGPEAALMLEDIDYRQIPLFIKEYNLRNEGGDNKYFAYKIISNKSGEILENEYEVDRVYNDKIRATDEINLLFENALIVRLKTNRRKIEAYQKAGMMEKADKLEKELNMTNQETIQIFKRNFSFCPIYFINAEDYNLALNEQPGIFLNERGEKDESIVFDYRSFLFCDRGAAYAPVIANQKDANTKMVSSTPSIQDAFVIKNMDLEQLVEPFPYKAAIRFDNIEGAVSNLNSSLINFYGK